MGLKAPLIHDHDDLAAIAVETVKGAVDEGIKLRDRDILCITESVLARSQGNYATQRQITTDFRDKFQGDHLGVVFPILSRNRFSEILKAIQAGFKKTTVQLSYPADEVGNHLISIDQMLDKWINPYEANMDYQEFRSMFGPTVHTFTGIDYVEYYKSLGKNIDIIFSNDPTYILNHTDEVLAADIHSRFRTKDALRKDGGCSTALSLDEIMTEPVDGSGYNETYGLLGSNKATEGKLKLFPRDCQKFVDKVQSMLAEAVGVKMEVMVYGDGAFKCPVSTIWEFADPVVSPGFTYGLNGTPKEIKLKYQIDSLSEKGLSRQQVDDAIKKMLAAENEPQQGTTPRQLTDLLGSLADLVSGSGGKGTPLVLVQGYFNNWSR